MSATPTRLIALLSAGLIALSGCAETARIAADAIHEVQARPAVGSTPDSLGVQLVSGYGVHDITGRIDVTDRVWMDGFRTDWYLVTVAEYEALTVEVSSASLVALASLQEPVGGGWREVAAGAGVLDVPRASAGEWYVGVRAGAAEATGAYTLRIELYEQPSFPGSTPLALEARRCTDPDCVDSVEQRARSQMTTLVAGWRSRAGSTAARRRIDAAQRAWQSQAEQRCLDETSNAFGGQAGGSTINGFYRDCERHELFERVASLETQSP